MKANKSLGQNFLQDRNILSRIVESIDLTKNDLVIEIGPGQGALTKYLKLFNASLICYEVDTDLEKYLSLYVDDKTKKIVEINNIFFKTLTY